MPSSKNYVRDYVQERKTETKARKHARVERNQARQIMISKGKTKVGDGKDVDHIQPISKGGKTTLANLRVESASKNRSYSRHSDGSMVSNKPKKGKK